MPCPKPTWVGSPAFLNADTGVIIDLGLVVAPKYQYERGGKGKRELRRNQTQECWP